MAARILSVITGEYEKKREQHNQHNSYDTFRYNERDGYRGLEHNHSGARPKTNQNPILDYRQTRTKTTVIIFIPLAIIKVT